MKVYLRNGPLHEQERELARRELVNGRRPPDQLAHASGRVMVPATRKHAEVYELTNDKDDGRPVYDWMVVSPRLR